MLSNFVFQQACELMWRLRLCERDSGCLWLSVSVYVTARCLQTHVSGLALSGFASRLVQSITQVLMAHGTNVKGLLVIHS